MVEVLVCVTVQTGLLLNAVPNGIVQATGTPVPTVTRKALSVPTIDGDVPHVVGVPGVVLVVVT